MLSVSAAHQFAVNRWNPGYTGGRVTQDRGDRDSMQTKDGQGTLFVCFLGYAGERATGTVKSQKRKMINYYSYPKNIKVENIKI